MFRTILGIIGFSAKRNDRADRHARIERRYSGLPSDAVEGLKVLHRVDEQPQYTGKIGQAKYQGSFEMHGQEVGAREFVQGLKTEFFAPIGNAVRDSARAAMRGETVQEYEDD